MTTDLNPMPAALARPTQTTAVEQARAVAEVLAAVQVAQQCPRDIRRAWADMQAACSRLSLAERAFYTVKNRGTSRPSIHLARELARIWGNLDYGVHELSRDDERGMSEVRTFAWDQQTNVRPSRTLQVPHQRMVGRERKPLTDLGDVYLNNQNIGARAVRECIFSALPADFVAEAQDICRQTIERGDGKPLVERIANLVQAFAGIGIKVPQIEKRLDRKRGQWTAADVADLGVVYRSIQQGETTVGDEFPPELVTVAELGGPAPRPAPSPDHASAEGGDWPPVAGPPADAPGEGSVR
ncbi:hypothetical protein ABZS66_19055 [Dactylosporangium sp. NPDC005572]|uniref:hypothetical protein n=1 Tax=Dactylosporangium sp. NPDC005572 TaxID=3156889 RepID=UPI0033B121DD